MIDFIDHLVPSWLDKLFRIVFDHFHFSTDGLVLLLEFFEIAEGSIYVIFVVIAFWDEGDVVFCSQIEVHNGLIMKI